MKNQTYEEFYLKYRKISKAYAYGILHDWNMADDVSQDVLYKMYNMRKGLNVDNEKMMYSLIRRSSVNKAMDLKRSPVPDMSLSVQKIFRKFWKFGDLLMRKK